MSVHIAAFRQALAALYSSPETTVGEAVVRFCRVEILCEFALRDVGDQADMRAGCLDGAATIERTEIATIPGAAEQGREVPLGPPQGMENGGEFFREREQAAVRGRLLIAQRIDKRSAGVKRAVVTRSATQGWSTSAKRRRIWFQLVPLRALLDSPTSTTKRLRPWRVASTMQWGAGPTALPNATSSWRRRAAGWASLCGARARTAKPATP